MGAGAVTEQEPEGRGTLTGSRTGGTPTGGAETGTMLRCSYQATCIASTREETFCPGHIGLHQGTMCTLSLVQWLLPTG